MFAFDNGVHAYFGSRASDRSGSSRFGTTIYGSKGVIELPNATYPKGQPRFLRSHRWMPDEKRTMMKPSRRATKQNLNRQASRAGSVGKPAKGSNHHSQQLR